MSTLSIAELSSHLPVDALIQNGKPEIEWIRIANNAFNDPFFHETVERIRRQWPQPESVYTDLHALLQVAKLANADEPAGFIFHTSRCGSTLVANACRALNNSRVIAEAPVIDKLISRLFTDGTAGSAKELVYLTLIRAAIDVLGHTRDARSFYVVKFACVSLLQIKRIRRIWPNVPIVVLYRHPLEIMVSNLGNIPQWMAKNNNPETAAAIVGLPKELLPELSNEEFCARALGQYYSAAEEAANDPATMLLSYEELSPQALGKLFEFFGRVPSAEELTKVAQLTEFYSKDTTRPFLVDGDQKRRTASVFAIQMTDDWAMPQYERLCAKTDEVKRNSKLRVTLA